jgi:hypothetical protein
VKKSILYVFLAAVLLMFSVTGAQADYVTFSNIVDGDGVPLNFDAAATAAGAVGTSNTLDLITSSFTADGNTPFLSALDTLSFTVTAPAGYWITNVSYSETVFGDTTQGVAVATGSITADGTPKNLPLWILVPGSGFNGTTISSGIAIDKKTEVAVSIVNSLFATTFGGPNDIAYITKEIASVDVEIAQIPIPSALLLLSSGLVCLIGLRRNRK